ncbi:sensor histidine kinase [Sporosarcina sp. CAU 1771]
MFLNYLKDMKSWVLFFIVGLALADLLIWLDKGMDMKLTSVLYFNILLATLFVLFVVLRFFKETRFSKELSILVDEPVFDWHEALPETTFARDEVVSEILRKVAVSTSKELSYLKRESLIESDYTAAWVHEVKAPLTAMKLALDGQPKDPFVRKIEAEWLRVHLLIDQQLYISRLPTLETDYVLEPIDIYRLVTFEVRELASWCLEKNIAIEFEGEGIEVTTDVKWCRFIIRQLLTNAVKYSPIGGTITITAHVNPTGNTVLAIKDDGPGIKTHDLPRIFDKGFTGSTGRLHNAATGLGLYLAQTVATKIGITLQVQSESEQGTNLYMTFSTENEFDKVLK